ncbi:ShlB/FhaC/HecB family hemolysin secretion/activation protein [Pseudomonas putida]|nr:ShlB/FhaC/HecB family hemolysin secretion/activation protein [Pseudomonas putida]
MPTLLSRIASWLSIGLIPACLAALPAQAADPASEQLRDQQRTLRQLEQQQRLQQWRRRPAPTPTREPTTDERPGGRCWAIPSLRLRGNRQVSSATLDQALRPLLAPCLDVASINRLLKAITERYVAAGYPASRPYLALQPQDGQPLDIVIVEGFVESIELSDADLPLSLQGAFPGLLGNPLYLPDLEQGLDQLNRLRAYDLGADLLPGALQGGTRVIIQPRQVGSRWHLDSRLDNRGSELTGRHRLNLGLGLDSPLGLNDDLRLALVSAVFHAPGQSQGASLYYTVPYGPWTFALNASWMRYKAPLPNGRQVSSGTSSLQGMSLERMLWRNQQGLLSTVARLDRKALVNRIDGATTRQQSPTLTTLEAGLNLLWLDGGLWNAYLGVAQSLDWLGAEHPAQVPGLATRAHFRKYRANLLHLRQGPAQWPWRWQGELNLQYSREALPAIEQLLLSDDSAVRGWRQATVAGASGAVWRNTFSQPLPIPAPLEIRPQLGLDLGWTRFNRNAPSQRLAGASLGVELARPGNRLRLDYQRALYASDRNQQSLEPGIWVLEWALSI